MFHRFLVFFKASRKFAFGFPDITLVTIVAWDRVDGATSLIFRYWVFRFRKQIPDGLVWFLSNFDVKRKFSTRLKEHQKAVEQHSQKPALAEHCLRSGHTVSWEASKILRTSANWHNRRILEAWEINTCRNPLNRDDGMYLPHEFLNLALRDRT